MNENRLREGSFDVQGFIVPVSSISRNTMARVRLSICCFVICAFVVRAALANELPVWAPYQTQQDLVPPVEIIQAQFLQPQVCSNCDDPYCACDPYSNFSGAQQVHAAQPVGGLGLSSSQFTNAFTTVAPVNRVFELLPSDLIWHSFWASAKEPRTSGVAFNEFSDDLALLDVSLGGRTAIARNASRNQFGQWYGWELQIEGAALLRLNLDQNWDFDSADFRFGIPLILARNQVHWKIAYYHLSSHVGDEFLVRNPGFQRINFSRDVIVLGGDYFPVPQARLYGEVGYAFVTDGGSEPFEFQFGLDLAQPGPTGAAGTPFLALNGHLREEVDFGGNFVLQAGWLWRGQTGRVLRTGLHYYNGKSPQFEFFDSFEQQIGVGLWQEY